MKLVCTDWFFVLFLNRDLILQKKALKLLSNFPCIISFYNFISGGIYIYLAVQ